MQEIKMPKFWRILVIAMTICSLNAFTNLDEYARLSPFLQRGVKVLGTVKSCVDNKLDTCIAVIRYNVNGLDSYLTHPKWPCEHEKCFGTLVNVVYDPDNPNVAIDLDFSAIRGFQTAGILSGLIAIITVIWFVASVTRLWIAARNQQKATN